MSIVDVARMAGVTHGTVSRLINGRGGVAPGTARRIREAIARLGYRPSPEGRRRGRRARPVGIRTGNICLLLVGAPREVLDRPGISTVMTTLEAELRERGLGMLLARSDGLRDLPPCVGASKADGVVLVGETSDPMAPGDFPLPAVWILSSHTRPQCWADHVLPDNERVGQIAAGYLARRGHRRVTFYNDQPGHPGFVARGLAFEAAARASGMECRTYIAPRPRGGALWGFGASPPSAALVARMLRERPRPRALFVPTDEQAVRLYPLLARAGIAPGSDLDLVSCDNRDVWLRQLDPRPPSIDLNFELIGRRAVEQLLSRITHPGEPPGTRILVPPSPLPGEGG